MSLTVEKIASNFGLISQSQSPIEHIVLDSRQVNRTTAFVAVPGGSSDGRKYVEQSLVLAPPAIFLEAKGLEAFFADDALKRLERSYPQTSFFVLENLNTRLGELAKLLYPLPEDLLVGAVTGTNGKTTVSSWVAGACDRAHRPVGLCGTLGLGTFGRLTPSANTTPDVFTLHRFLANTVNQGGRVAMMEASSHALAQGRLQGLPITTAVWTQLSQDHLDYHGSMAAYAAEKLKLLRWPGLKYCVLNLADATALKAYQSGAYCGQALTYCVAVEPKVPKSVAVLADYCVQEIEYGVQGLALSLSTPSGPYHWQLPFWGQHNAENALAAALCLVSFGWDFHEASKAVALQPLPAGRLERFSRSGFPAVIVDYAHTPDALSHLLQSVRRHCQGRLWVVFGCGGNRDRAKRPLMGKIAQALADHVILTNDNPRFENPHQIIEDILSGFSEPASPLCEPDRSKAIALAVKRAQPEDVVVIAGKGHEDYQDICGNKFPFCDRRLTQELLGIHNGQALPIEEL